MSEERVGELVFNVIVALVNFGAGYLMGRTARSERENQNGR